MRVLWVTTIPFGHHFEMLSRGNQVHKGSGTWLYAAYETASADNSIQLHIATVADVKEVQVSEYENNVFYLLPKCLNERYWMQLRKTVVPDIVIIWGTESIFSYYALKAMDGLPSAIYIQGLVGSIFQHYWDGVPAKYQKKTLRDHLDTFRGLNLYENFRKKLYYEKQMLGMADAVIVENDWAEDYCKSINQCLHFYRSTLPIKESFFQYEWNLNSINKHTIFVNGGGYPIKGHHVLFEALSIVRKKYPDLRCYIPGGNILEKNDFLHRTSYSLYLERLIKDYNLNDTVCFTGPLSSDQMAEYIANCHVYVMPSIVENHSSSLIEALVVGAPCITSLVGGVQDVVRHKNNGLVYNSLDATSLAGNIIRLFEDDTLCERLHENALLERSRRKGRFGVEMLQIYKSLCEDK